MIVFVKINQKISDENTSLRAASLRAEYDRLKAELAEVTAGAFAPSQYRVALAA